MVFKLRFIHSSLCYDEWIITWMRKTTDIQYIQDILLLKTWWNTCNVNKGILKITAYDNETI